MFLTPEEQAALEALCKSHGTYKVTAAIASISKAASKETWVSNPEAIIHRDALALSIAVDLMRDSHPLRHAAGTQC